VDPALNEKLSEMLEGFESGGCRVELLNKAIYRTEKLNAAVESEDAISKLGEPADDFDGHPVISRRVKLEEGIFSVYALYGSDN